MADRRGVFLSWAPFSRRSETLAARFGLDLRFVSSPWPKRPLATPVKYPVQAVRTVALLVARRPTEVWVMDPPYPAVALAWLYCRLCGASLVVDVHTVAFYSGTWRRLQSLEKPFLRAARAVIVTNESLARRARSWGAATFVLPDPLPDPPPDDGAAIAAETVAVIATYSDDEPLHLLPPAALKLPEVEFSVTGSPRGSTAQWPANLHATGFLDDAAYWRLLRRSAAIAVLTTRPDTLLSGGYEALSVRRPLVVSDHAVLREYFGDAAVFAGGSVDGLVDGVRRALADGEGLAGRMAALAQERRSEWERAAQRLLDAVRGE